MIFFIFPAVNLNKRWEMCKNIIKENSVIKNSYSINFSKKSDGDFKKLIKMIYCVSDDSHGKNIHRIESKVNHLCKFSKIIKVIEIDIDPDNRKKWLPIKCKIRQKADSKKYMSVHTPLPKYVRLTKYYLSLLVTHSCSEVDIDKINYNLEEKNTFLLSDCDKQKFKDAYKLIYGKPS